MHALFGKVEIAEQMRRALHVRIRYMPTAGDEFQILTDLNTSGDFSQIIMPNLSPGLILVALQDSTG
jgi:hypothetical protein